ncbi:hypothetical protein Tco_0638487 [Tanacetum coccineum]
MAICTKLFDRVLDLEKEKDAQAVEILKLKNIIKKLERKAKSSILPPKRRLYKQVDSFDDSLGEENASKQGRSLIEEMDLDAGISLVPPHNEVQGRYGQNLETQEELNTASTFVSTASPQRHADTTADDLTLADTLREIRKSAAKDKEVAQKLQEEFDAVERQRMAQVHQPGQGFIYVEWDDVLARVVADEDFVKYPIIDWEVYSEDIRRYWRIIRVGNHTKAYQIFADMLKKFNRDDLVKLWNLVKERFSTTEPTDDKEKEL